MNIFTFWEGSMPDYIRLCLRTWRIPFTMLNYGNLRNYTAIDVEPLKRFTLPQIADCVRVHVLRDQGGYWLDADTVMLSDKLPGTAMVGDPIKRTNNIGYLYAQQPHMDLFEEWAAYQDGVIADQNATHHWSVMGNMFTDGYVKEHDVSIHDVRRCFPETYMIEDTIPRCDKYVHFYFSKGYHLPDIEKTEMLMLHNSWTPNWYKELTESEVLTHDCTLSNILRETL